MARNPLLVPFLTDDPVFAHGVEVGMLFWQMAHGGEGLIEGYFLIDNEEQILVMASRLGWHAEQIERGEWPGWFWCRLEKQ